MMHHVDLEPGERDLSPAQHVGGTLAGSNGRSEKSDGDVQPASMLGGRSGPFQLHGDRLVGTVDRRRQMEAPYGIVVGNVGEATMESDAARSY